MPLRLFSLQSLKEKNNQIYIISNVCDKYIYEEDNIYEEDQKKYLKIISKLSQGRKCLENQTLQILKRNFKSLNFKK